MASRLITDLDPSLQPLAQKFLDACNADPVFTDAEAAVLIDGTYRSNEEQHADFLQGRQTPGNIITDLDAGSSAHNATLADGTPAAMAFDFAIQLSDRQLDWSPSDPLWQRAIAIGIGLGLVSGSQWKTLKDFPHLQMAGWSP